MAFLELKNLDVYYGKACALSGICLGVEQKGIVGIIGPNGAGKSTLLDSILGLTRFSGEIVFDGQDLTRLRPDEIVASGIGYAPERRNLFAHMTVLDNLLIGGYRAGQAIRENLRMVFELFPILEKRKRQEAGTQSGGEQQMVSLGRALMTNPRLLMVDEPTIGLAPLICQEISRALRELRKKKGIAVLIAEQNVNFTLTLSERIYLLETGRIRMQGRPEELAQEQYIQETYFGL